MAAQRSGRSVVVVLLGRHEAFDTGQQFLFRHLVEIDGLGLVVVGIGGIGPANAADVIRAGCDGIAVVSAIVSAADPERAAAELLTIIRKAQEES